MYLLLYVINQVKRIFRFEVCALSLLWSPTVSLSSPDTSYEQLWVVSMVFTVFNIPNSWFLCVRFEELKGITEKV